MSRRHPLPKGSGGNVRSAYTNKDKEQTRKYQMSAGETNKRYHSKVEFCSSR